MQHLVDRLQQDRGSNLHGLRPHCGGSDVRREFAWKTSQSRTCSRVGQRDINCVESAAPSRASDAQVCPKWASRKQKSCFEEED